MSILYYVLSHKKSYLILIMRLIYQNYAPFCKVINKTFMAAYDKPSFAKLESRSIFIVNGPETRKFLQGVTTNNISPLYEPSANK